ncbi:conserved exported hypothetical protein [Candidatus Zixiibacteriota bacterium]|nr:conserved exported hypothetical protein [candidate division Zixibacteria bacterium]
MRVRSSIIKFTVFFLVCGVSASASPRLVIPDSTFNFGFVPRNARVSHIFWLHSLGVDTLKILKVDPGCGCTRAPLGKSELAPGDSTALEIIFSTGYYSGWLTKHPGLLTNEGSDVRLLDFAANIVVKPDSTSPVIFEPYKFELPPFENKTRPSLNFAVRNVSGQPLEMTLVDFPPGMFKINYPKKIKPGESAAGKIEITKNFDGKDFAKSITFQMNDKEKTRFTIPVTGAIRVAVPDSAGSSSK